jgi:hypothetical protein
MAPGVQMTIASGQPGASANDLTDERQLDELSGNAALNGVPVQVAGRLRRTEHRARLSVTMRHRADL